VIFTGRESTEEMERERPTELDDLKEFGDLEAHVVPPMKTWHKLLLKTWGWLAFLTGIVLLAFIVYSMIL